MKTDQEIYDSFINAETLAWKEISRDDYDYNLGVLPPEKWLTVDDVNIFRCEERTSFSYTRHSAAYKGRYFQKEARLSADYRELAAEIKAIVDGEAKITAKPAACPDCRGTGRYSDQGPGAPKGSNEFYVCSCVAGSAASNRWPQESQQVDGARVAYVLGHPQSRLDAALSHIGALEALLEAHNIAYTEFKTIVDGEAK